MSMKSIVSKYEPQDANTYVGKIGEAWVDNESAALHIGDNVTAGGVVVRGTGNLLVQNDTIATQDNGKIFLNTGAADGRFFWAEYGDFTFTDNNETWADASATDSMGNKYLLGATYIADAPSPSAILVKYSPTGELLWNYVLVDTDSYDGTFGGGIWIDKDDYIYVAMAYHNGSLYNTITKFADDGNIKWSEIAGIDADYDFYVYDLQGDNAGHLYLLAQVYYDFGGGAQRCYAVMKCPSNHPGNSTASAIYGLPNRHDFDTGGIDVSSHGVVVTGGMYDTYSGSWKAYVAKFDSDLNLQWHNKIGLDGGYDQFYSSCTDTEGNVYPAGQSANGAFVCKYNASGALQWQRILDAGGSTYITQVVADTNGSIYYTGYSYDLPDYDGLIVGKIGTELGTLEWQNQWEGTKEGTYEWYENNHRALSLKDDVLAIAGYTYVGPQPGEQLYEANAILLTVPTDGSCVDNRFVNFNYNRSTFDWTASTYTNVPLALDFLYVATNVWGPFDLVAVEEWWEGPNSMEPIFNSVTYALGSLYEFGTDNNIVVPVGGDVVDANGVSVTGKQYNWTNSNDNTWRTVTTSGATEFYYNSSGDSETWWTPGTILGDVAQFRGAIIEFHAFTGRGTVIGHITWSRNYPDDFSFVTSYCGIQTGQEFANGSTAGNFGPELYYKDSNNGGYNVMIQWTAKMFYGSEWGC